MNISTPVSDETQLEASLIGLGKTAPRLSPAMIDEKIVSTYYQIVPGTTLTICVLTLVNGFSVTGTAAAASAENFNQHIGESIAFKNARDKIWELEGYLLRQRLHEEHITKTGSLEEAMVALVKDGADLHNFINAHNEVHPLDARAKRIIEAAESSTSDSVNIDDPTIISGTDCEGDWVLGWIWAEDPDAQEAENTTITIDHLARVREKLS